MKSGTGGSQLNQIVFFKMVVYFSDTRSISYALVFMTGVVMSELVCGSDRAILDDQHLWCIAYARYVILDDLCL